MFADGIEKFPRTRRTGELVSADLHGVVASLRVCSRDRKTKAKYDTDRTDPTDNETIFKRYSPMYPFNPSHP
jgi:hypothetical protein